MAVEKLGKALSTSQSISVIVSQLLFPLSCSYTVRILPMRGLGSQLSVSARTVVLVSLALLYITRQERIRERSQTESFSIAFIQDLTAQPQLC